VPVVSLTSEATADAAGSGNGLADTGSDLVGLGDIGMLLLLAGAVLGPIARGPMTRA
jgi:hypothetical protein